MQFYKYQGTGNDFIMIDDRTLQFDSTNYSYIKQLCDRHFGIGADGLILLRTGTDFDFEMVYYNSDGNPSSMCGNGGRCIARFAQHLNIIDSHCTFKAVDGMHEAQLNADEVALKMNNVNDVQQSNGLYILNTGSPHVVKYTDDVNSLNVFEEGRKIRNSDRFKVEGTNVNFVLFENNVLKIRTYERGVEDETLSCGTGITAAALAHSIHSNYKAGNHTIHLDSQGGMLKVNFNFDGSHTFSNVYLIGPAEFVFRGDLSVE